MDQKLWIAYWPSQWQAATETETVVDFIFGIFSSRESAISAVRSYVSKEEWELYNDQFVYEELELDRLHPIPHV
jgi:hypothetical protein